MTWMRQMPRWALLIAVTLAVTMLLTRVGVPSAALFAALVAGIALALSPLPSAGRCPHSLAPSTMVHQDAVGAAAPLMARGVVWVSERVGRQTRAITAPSREPIRVAD
jgi:hypothetical protein